MRKPGSYKAKAKTSLSFDLQSLIDQHHPIFRFLLTSVSSQSWSVGRQPSTTISNVVSCAAHCANLRQTDPCSCNAILFVRETGDCIVGTARLPLKTEDTERVYIVEGTGGLFLFEKNISITYGIYSQRFGAGVHGQNTLQGHNIEIGPVSRHKSLLMITAKIKSCFNSSYAIYQVGFCSYQIHCDGQDYEEETCGELKEFKLSSFYM